MFHTIQDLPFFFNFLIQKKMKSVSHFNFLFYYKPYLFTLTDKGFLLYGVFSFLSFWLKTFHFFFINFSMLFLVYNKIFRWFFLFFFKVFNFFNLFYFFKEKMSFLLEF